MTRKSIVALAFGTAALAGCAANPAPVPLTADPAGQVLVIGEWSGDYYTSDGSQAGSILLRFERHDTTEVACFGDVVIIPRMQPNLPPNEGRDENAVAPVQVLAIEHVDVRGREISGTMAAYTDPETGESLKTWFDGQISGDAMSGTLYTTHSRTGRESSGTWQATRKKTEVPGK